MKLKPILIPTEDAKSDSVNGLLITNGKLHKPVAGGEYRRCIQNVSTANYLYLVSYAPIKEGDWFINISGLWKHNGIIEPESTARKIILTTNPNIIADGVPAIDGNTKAHKYISDPDVKRKEVNFLTELCKCWNDKADIAIEVEMEDYVRPTKYEWERYGEEPKIKFKDGQPTLIFK